MRILEIEVTASATIPTVPYGNVRPAVQLRATLAEGEDPAAAVDMLQRHADALMLKHAARLAELTKEAEL